MNFKEWIIPSTAMVAACYLVYYFSHEKDKVKVDKEIDKRTVVNILNEIRKEFLRIDIKFSASKQLNNNDSETNSVQDMTDKFEENLKRVEAQILEKFNVAKKTLNFACETKYKDDNEIKALVFNIRNEIDCTKRGESLINPAFIPKFLTPELTLQILSELVDLFIIEKYREKLNKEFTESNDIDNLYIFKVDENIKHKIFANYGLTVCKYPPDILLIVAINRDISDGYFKQQYLEILNKRYLIKNQNEIEDLRERYSWILD